MGGSVPVRPLDVNRAEVTVALHTPNALTFVVKPDKLIPGTSCVAFPDVDLKAGPLLMGVRALTIPPLAARALGESFFRITFINPAGGPLPDLSDLFIQRRRVRPTPDGSYGTVTLVQAGNGARTNIQPAIVSFRQESDPANRSASLVALKFVAGEGLPLPPGRTTYVQETSDARPN
jgi:hypothetical protein